MGQIHQTQGQNPQLQSLDSLFSQNITKDTGVTLKEGGRVGKQGLGSKIWASFKSMSEGGRREIKAKNSETKLQLCRMLESRGISTRDALALSIRDQSHEVRMGKKLLQGSDIQSILDIANTASALTKKCDSEIARLAQSPEAAVLSRPHAALSALLASAKEVANLDTHGQRFFASQLMSSLTQRPDGLPTNIINVKKALEEISAPSFQVNLQSALLGISKNDSLSSEEKVAFTASLKNIMQMTTESLEMRRASLLPNASAPQPLLPPLPDQRRAIDTAFSTFATKADVHIGSIDAIREGIKSQFTSLVRGDAFLRETSHEVVKGLKTSTATSLISLSESLQTAATSFAEKVKPLMLAANPALRSEDIRGTDISAFVKSSPNRATIQNLAFETFKATVDSQPDLKRAMQASFTESFRQFVSVIDGVNNPNLSGDEVIGCREKLLSALFLSSTSAFFNSPDRTVTAFFSGLNGLVAGNNPDGGLLLRNYLLGI